MDLVTLNVLSTDLPPSQLPSRPGEVTWVVYEGGKFLRSFNFASGAQTFIDALMIRRLQQRESELRSA